MALERPAARASPFVPGLERAQGPLGGAAATGASCEVSQWSRRARAPRTRALFNWPRLIAGGTERLLFLSAGRWDLLIAFAGLAGISV